MTKTGMNHMAEWLALELVRDRIRVNSLAPGLVPTKMSSPLVTIADGVIEDWPTVKGTTEEVAAYAATMCSKEGKFLNGEVVFPHGGMLTKL